MIAKIKTRADFGGIVNYANDQKNKKKSATLLAYEGICAINNKTIADSFQIQASMRPKVKSPVKHVSLAFSPQDTIRFPNDEKGNALMMEIAKKWMEQMGIRNTQYIIARHSIRTLCLIPIYSVWDLLSLRRHNALGIPTDGTCGIMACQ